MTSGFEFDRVVFGQWPFYDTESCELCTCSYLHHIITEYSYSVIILCFDPKAPVMNIHIYLSPAAFDLKILFEGKTLQSSKSMGMTDSVLQISLAL